MYAIIRQGNGKFYTTMVFGYYDYPKNEWDYMHRYCVVLNEEKNGLILQPVFAEKELVPTVIFTDNDESNWKKINDNIMSVFFLPTEELYNWVLDQKVPDDLLQKCIAMDAEYDYNPYPYILNEKDVHDLLWAVGGFHDGKISEIKQTGDVLYVAMTDIWGCNLEMWFEGDTEYDISSRNPELYDPYWGGGTIFFHEDHIYLVDDEYATIANVTNGWCWFKARKMKYHLIPV